MQAHLVTALPRITDALVRCHLCGTEAPVLVMTMTDDELWECDTGPCGGVSRA